MKGVRRIYKENFFSGNINYWDGNFRVSIGVERHKGYASEAASHLFCDFSCLHLWLCIQSPQWMKGYKNG